MNKQKDAKLVVVVLVLPLLLWIIYQLYTGNAYFGTRYNTTEYSRINNPPMYWGIVLSEIVFLLYTIFSLFRRK